ncbi:MAG: DUF6457 domain-containing protein [Microthrixaceae bacterium]
MTDEPLDPYWIDRFAEQLGVDRLDEEQVEALLELAGHAAHDSGDRRNAPLSCFLTGLRLGADAAAPTPEQIRSVTP